MAIRWTDSADKHGVSREDAANAILNHVYRVQEFDEPRIEGGARPDLFIGPSVDRRTMLEVMAIITPPNDILVFHVMEARRKSLT
ncbi:hypothetical protein [Arthrobacter cavernae]|uniref:Uncharacterized protein n=1 Tax=Arthrobacter cavernae TaxID=2817681 RepID=A0A939HM53_9MICC|nr:hypothetical protein [Arthrobacter cavernae]MBO1269900.1 hypothetical protein [Arthrobacter cavernae]